MKKENNVKRKIKWVHILSGGQCHIVYKTMQWI